MLLLLTTLALAQDPAPEGETQSTPVSETETSVPSEGLTPVVKVVAPKAVGTYKQGYDAGRVAAEEFVDWLQPAVAGAGVGAGAAGVGVVCGGVVCGAPAVLGGAGYQTYKTRHGLLDSDHFARCSLVSKSLSATAWRRRSIRNIGLILRPVEVWHGVAVKVAR